MACLVCKGVLKEPVSTPCGHHFCKPCLEKKFAVRTSSAGLLAHAAAAGHITNTVFGGNGPENGQGTHVMDMLF